MSRQSHANMFVLDPKMYIDCSPGAPDGLSGAAGHQSADPESEDTLLAPAPIQRTDVRWPVRGQAFDLTGAGSRRQLRLNGSTADQKAGATIRSRS